MHRLPVATALVLVGLVVPLLPAHAATSVRDASQHNLTVIQDGTSNTILFSETNSELAICFDGVSVAGAAGIADGSSNTLVFGEDVVLHVVAGGLRQRAPVGEIADGTSNTIVIGEISGLTEFCLADVTVPPSPPADGTSNTIIVGEDSSFDVCFRNVGHSATADGTSNTIVLPEIVSGLCFLGGVRTELAATAVPEPVPLALLGLGLTALWLGLRRRGGHARPVA